MLDASDPNASLHYQTVVKVLTEINADQNERLIVLNKCDNIQDDSLLYSLKVQFPDAVCVSAKTHMGLTDLQNAISKKLLGALRTYNIPGHEFALIREIRANGVITKEEWTDTHVQITARITGRTQALAKPYAID